MKTNKKIEKRQKLEKDPDENEKTEKDLEDIIDVDIDVFHPVPEDIHDIAGLLKRFIDVHPFHRMDMADLLIAQGKEGLGIGSVVSTNEGEDVVGIISCIDLDFHRKHNGVADCLDFFSQLISKYKSGASDKLDLQTSSSSQSTNESTWKDIIKQGCRTGLFLYERLVNIPQELTPHLYRSLISEIARSTSEKNKKSPSYLEKPQMRLDTILVCSRIGRLITDMPEFGDSEDEEGDPRAGKGKSRKEKDGKKKRKKIRKAKNDFNEETSIFFHPEDEIFLKYKIDSFIFPIEDDPFLKAGEGVELRGLLYAISFDNFKKAADELFDFFSVDRAELPKKPDE
eukprot:MONOS_4522.1-p1 / transcript=MONOS_4522.1 / gene=MONOS_4522 / organism=Monocercomonoides_exilis_PA203 / gene_product=unspecified product / transcript_product=unspecified product / location=Mono_scaffold00121:59167-60189(-) / protein_length=340 / sequence_SO=supercontig / SO=protein_coding / is_pseudo=false